MGHGVSAFVQPNFRIRSDDSIALNTDSGWAAAINTDATIDAHKRFRIRIEVEETAGNSNNTQFKLQVKKNAGSFVDAVEYLLSNPNLTLNGTPLAWIGESTIYADLDVTTNLLSGSSATFASGDGCETPVTGTVSLASEHTEFEFVLVIPTFYDSADQNVDGDTFEFRLVESDSTVFAGTYVNPVITLNVPSNMIGGTLAESPNHIGPFVDDNDNMYFIHESAETTATIMMIKSTDDGVTWAPVDQANATADTDLESVDVVQDGHDLHILHHPGAVVNYSVFHMSSHATLADKWDTTIIDEDVAGAVTNPLEQFCSMQLRSDGTVVALYTESDGTNERIRYRIRSTGGTWGAENNLDATASTDFFGVNSVLGASDLIYIFYKDQTNGDILFKTLNSSDTLSGSTSVETNAGTSTDERSNLVPAIYYDDGGVEVIVIGYTDDTDNLLYTRHLRNGTLQTRAAASDNAVQENHPGGNSRQPAATMGVFGKNVHAFYAHATNNDVYYDTNDDEAGWGTDTLEISGVNVGNIRGMKISRGGSDYFGYIYEDTAQTGHFLNDPDFDSGYTGGHFYGELAVAAGINTQAVAGALSFSGDVSKKTSKSVAGALTFAGDIAKKSFEALSGAVSFAGDVATQSRFSKALAGALNFSGDVSKKTSKTISGAISFSGDLVKKTAKVLSGAITFSGIVTPVKGAALFLQSVAGALTFSGDLSLSSRFSKLLEGTFSSSGTISKKSFESLAGALSFSGDLVKKTKKILSGTFSSSGILSAVKLGALKFQSIAGAITFAGDLSLSSKFTKLLEGTLSFSGSITKKTFKLFQGSFSSIGQLSKKTFQPVSGAIAFSGDLVKKTSKTLSGAITFAGDLVGVRLGILYFQAVDGAITFSGDIVKKTSKTLLGVWNGGSTLSKTTKKALSGAFNSSGELSKKMFLLLQGSISFSGVVAAVKGAALYFQSIAGSLSFSGTVSTSTLFHQLVSGSLSFAGNLLKLTKKSFYGTIGLSGSLSKKTSKILTGAISFSGFASKKLFLLLQGSLSFVGTVSTALNPLLDVLQKFLAVGSRFGFDFNLSSRSQNLTTEKADERIVNLDLLDRSQNLTTEKADARSIDLSLPDRDQE